LSIDFIEKAFLAGSGIALIAGPLGSWIVWRRMTNFGDALGHSTLLGVCFAWLLNINLYWGLVAVGILLAGLLTAFSNQKQITNDSLLTILAQTALSLGLVLSICLPEVRIDLLGYLYGDILAVEPNDLLWIAAVNCIGFPTLIYLWPSLLSMTLHEDIARVEGVRIVQTKWSLVLLITAVFAIAMRLVGALLITALLIIPASTARQFAKTPEQMAGLASVLGIIAVGLGILLSERWDWPTGPAIVLSSFSLFILASLTTKVLKNQNS